MDLRNCAYCKVPLLQAEGGIWLAKFTADLSGYCPNAPEDKHVPATPDRSAEEFSEAWL